MKTTRYAMSAQCPMFGSILLTWFWLPFNLEVQVLRILGCRVWGLGQLKHVTVLVGLHSLGLRVHI